MAEKSSYRETRLFFIENRSSEYSSRKSADIDCYVNMPVSIENGAKKWKARN